MIGKIYKLIICYLYVYKVVRSFVWYKMLNNRIKLLKDLIRGNSMSCIFTCLRVLQKSKMTLLKIKQLFSCNITSICSKMVIRFLNWIEYGTTQRKITNSFNKVFVK